MSASTQAPVQAPKEAASIEALMHQPLAEIAKQPNLHPLLERDITVSATDRQMPVEQCTFSITLSPGILDTVLKRPARDIVISVYLHDEFGNDAPPISVPLRSTGQTVTRTVEVPIRDRSVLHGPTDPGRWMYIIVDPYRQIPERSDSNNIAKTYCYTLG
jgi:hypothetical protein